jgi:hypothetical protein
MNRRGYQVCSSRSAWAAGALLLLGLAGCESIWNAPEGRALDFAETLVTMPADMQKLRDIANLAPERNPEDLLDGLSVRVALDFLRAKQTQGVALKFALGETRQINVSRRVVSIRVSYLQPGTPANSEVHLQVRIEKDDQGRWCITRVTGDS